jgi:uncharacterized protein (DUF433 family)
VGVTQVDRWRLERPAYAYAEADRIAGVSRGTSKRWLKGYQYPGPEGTTVWRPSVSTGQLPADYEPGVSFLELIEIAAIGRLKDAGLALQQVRRVVDACREILRSQRPLAELRFKTDGREVFVAADGALLDVGPRKRRLAWDEVLGPFLTTVEYEAGLARRWWPLGPERAVLVDPDYGFGLPVVAGSGVRTEIVWEQFHAGQDFEVIASDFGLTLEQVQDAIRFEAQRGGAPLAQTA